MISTALLIAIPTTALSSTAYRSMTAMATLRARGALLDIANSKLSPFSSLRHHPLCDDALPLPGKSTTTRTDCVDRRSASSSSTTGNAEWFEYIGYRVEDGAIKLDGREQRNEYEPEGNRDLNNGKATDSVQSSHSVSTAKFEVASSASSSSARVHLTDTLLGDVEEAPPYSRYSQPPLFRLSELDRKRPFADNSTDPADLLLQARQNFASRRGLFWESAIHGLQPYLLHPLQLTEPEFLGLCLTQSSETDEWLCAHLVESKELGQRMEKGWVAARTKLLDADIKTAELRNCDVQVFQFMEPDEQDVFIQHFKILRAHVTLCKEGLFLNPIAFKLFTHMRVADQFQYMERIKDEIEKGVRYDDLRARQHGLLTTEQAGSDLTKSFDNDLAYALKDLIFDNDGVFIDEKESVNGSGNGSTEMDFEASSLSKHTIHSQPMTPLQESDNESYIWNPSADPISYACSSRTGRARGKHSFLTLFRGAGNGSCEHKNGYSAGQRTTTKLRKSVSKLFGSLRSRDKSIACETLRAASGILDLEK